MAPVWNSFYLIYEYISNSLAIEIDISENRYSDTLSPWLYRYIRQTGARTQFHLIE